MSPDKINYFPVSGETLTILAVLWAVLIALIQLRAIQFSYERLGITPLATAMLLLAALLGSYLNIPVAYLPEKEFVSGQLVTYYGVRHVVPVVVDWPATIVAVNVGGALVPTSLSLYLLVKHRIWITGAIATLVVAAICHAIAKPVPGLGIALPVFVPAVAAAVSGLVLSREHSFAIAFVGGSLGALIGADLLNLDRVQGLGAPVVSIGGAGTFEGIFVSGIVAVLIASLRRPKNGA
jgi:uncharacterized membrane protein